VNIYTNSPLGRSLTTRDYVARHQHACTQDCWLPRRMRAASTKRRINLGSFAASMPSPPSGHLVHSTRGSWSPTSWPEALNYRRVNEAQVIAVADDPEVSGRSGQRRRRTMGAGNMAGDRGAHRSTRDRRHIRGHAKTNKRRRTDRPTDWRTD